VPRYLIHTNDIYIFLVYFTDIFILSYSPFVMPYQNESSLLLKEQINHAERVFFPTKENVLYSARRTSSLTWSSRTYFSVRNTEKRSPNFHRSYFGRSKVVRDLFHRNSLYFSLILSGVNMEIRSAHLFPETRLPRFSYGNKICRFWISIFADAKRKTCRASTIVVQKANDPSSLFGLARCSLLSMVIPG